jgi:hypothetical protein
LQEQQQTKLEEHETLKHQLTLTTSVIESEKQMFKRTRDSLAVTSTAAENQQQRLEVLKRRNGDMQASILQQEQDCRDLLKDCEEKEQRERELVNEITALQNHSHLVHRLNAGI